MSKSVLSVYLLFILMGLSNAVVPAWLVFYRVAGAVGGVMLGTFLVWVALPQPDSIR